MEAPMLESFAVLLLCQLVGEVVVTAADLPVPGPVVGMLVLLLGLLLKGGVPEQLALTASGLLQHLSLLFVPAGVGVMLHLALLGEQWPAVGLALLGSTVLTLLVTGLVMTWTARRTGAGP
jgi:holin-like protein